jgi:hypothetical protein
MTGNPTVAIAAASAFVLALGAAGAAQAGDKHWRSGGHYYSGGYYKVPPGHVHVIQPAPVVYAPAPVVVAPVYAAPVYAVPMAPVYAVPSRPVISFGAVIPLR